MTNVKRAICCHHRLPDESRVNCSNRSGAAVRSGNYLKFSSSICPVRGGSPQRQLLEILFLNLLKQGNAVCMPAAEKFGI